MNSLGELKQNCPIEFSMMMAMFCICTVQYGSHWPHVPTECLNVASVTLFYSFLQN